MNTKRENSLVIIAPLRTNAKRSQATAAEATLFFFPEISTRGGSRGRVQEVRTPPPPPPEMTCGFLIQLVFCKKKTLCGLLVLK